MIQISYPLPKLVLIIFYCLNIQANKNYTKNYLWLLSTLKDLEIYECNYHKPKYLHHDFTF
jgi:hypothetical protein